MKRIKLIDPDPSSIVGIIIGFGVGFAVGIYALPIIIANNNRYQLNTPQVQSQIVQTTKKKRKYAKQSYCCEHKTIPNRC